MVIKTIVPQHRRDFTAVYECEHCGREKRASGYDDTNFHDNVVPSMVCEYCGKKSEGVHEPRAPKYPEGLQV